MAAVTTSYRVPSHNPIPHAVRFEACVGSQDLVLLLVAPSFPANKAGLQIGSRFHGCVSFRGCIWRLFSFRRLHLYGREEPD